jgi:hypothetical protein
MLFNLGTIEAELPVELPRTWLTAKEASSERGFVNLAKTLVKYLFTTGIILNGDPTGSKPGM